MNEIHQLLVYADDVNLLVKNIKDIKKNRGSLKANKEVGWSQSKHGENKVHIDIPSPECRTKSEPKYSCQII
jgi:hypothetical protein